MDLILTQDKLLQKKILISKRELESFFDSIPHPICIISSGFIVKRANKAFSERVRLSFNEIVDAPYKGHWASGKKIDHVTAVREVLNFHREKTIHFTQSEGGEKRYYKLNYLPLTGKDGGVDSVVEFTEDVTDAESLKAELSKAYNHIQEELFLAQELQRSVLPKKIESSPYYDICVEFSPFSGVGGDLYDVVRIDETHTGFLILDVSGHGIASAFISVMAKMSFYHHAFGEVSPSRVLSLVNRDLSTNINTEHFATCLYCVYDTASKTITYSRASHPPALLLRRNGESFSLDSDGFFLGVDEGSVYGEERVNVNPGDRMFLYTDGIYEWELPSKKIFGQKQFNRMLCGIRCENIHQHVSDALSEIIDKTGAADLEDDITLVGVQFNQGSIHRQGDSIND